jgi:hypothetical protein
MSDPLAVYTQGGLGASDKGLNLKVGQSYDTGNPETMAMNIIEVKGIAGNSWAGVAQASVMIRLIACVFATLVSTPPMAVARS